MPASHVPADRETWATAFSSRTRSPATTGDSSRPHHRDRSVERDLRGRAGVRAIRRVLPEAIRAWRDVWYLEPDSLWAYADGGDGDIRPGNDVAGRVVLWRETQEIDPAPRPSICFSRKSVPDVITSGWRSAPLMVRVMISPGLTVVCDSSNEIPSGSPVATGHGAMPGSVLGEAMACAVGVVLGCLAATGRQAAVSPPTRFDPLRARR